MLTPRALPSHPGALHVHLETRRLTRGGIEAHTEPVKAHPKATEVHPGSAEAQSGALHVHPGAI
jgi:hypothetical protein